ncbi:MAG: S-layer homology domain-containing protein, partial [Ruminococcus sp.]|nr:S-layer homology domain-containing protein [Ruminococcus sp.]
SSNITYRIKRPVSGIDFDKNGGTITIDKDTGELLDFRLTWWNDAVFPDASKRLSVEEVSEIYKSRKPLEAKYQLFTQYEYVNDDYVTRQFILPVYVPKVYGENEIDAITGEYTAIYDDKKKYSYTDAYDWSGYDMEDEVMEEAAESDSYEANGGLSEAELAAVADESKYLSYEKCLEIIKKDEFIVFNKELVNQSNYLSDYTDIKGDIHPLRVLRFKFSSSDEKKDSISLRVEMDAVTGEIIAFSKSYDYGKNSPNNNKKGADDAAVLKRANEAAKHFIGSKASEYKADDAPYVYKSKDYTANNGSVHYNRYVNGLSASFDNMDISVDSRNEVLSFSYRYHDMEFPKPDLIGEDAAYKKLFENMKPSLEYTGFTDLQLKPHIYLTYYFDDSYVLNALTGERLSYDGSPFYTEEPEAEEKVIAYSDIKGYKYEKEIQTLLDYGIYITDSDKLAPDELITNGEFAQLFDGVCGTGIQYRVYPQKWDGNKYVPHKDIDKKLTRAELAKIYVYTYAGNYKDAAEVPGIYKAPFADVGSDHPYCGWIVFAKAEGMVSGSGGKFNPNAGITRGECLKLAYDFLAGDDNVRDIYEIVRIE